MNDTYKQLRKKVPELGAYCVDDDGFTAWVRAIQKASIIQLRPQDPWTNNEALIQVRTMQEEDLESKVDLPESEHEYEDTLDVIKLPLPIPTEVLAPHFLFIRPDEYALFKCFGKHNKCILIGNPGISKSWFQWKFILLCFRQDLLDILSPFEEEQVDNLHEDQLSLKGPTTEDQPSTKGPTTEDQPSTEQAPEEDLKVDDESLKGIKTDKQTSTDQVQVDDFIEYESSSKKPKIEEQTSTENTKCKDQAALKQNQLFIPNLIVRTVEGNKSYFFFMDQISNVLRVEHSPQQLDYFTDENSTILWEPGRGKAPVYFTDIKARIIATVSPNMKLFHQFHKVAEMFYLPCPSELQLRLIGQIYRKFATELDNCPGDEEIHKRVVELGPFIRMVMCWSSDKRFIFKKARNKEISRIVKNKARLHDALESPEKIMLTKEASHRLARYVVHRDKAQFFRGYTQCHYRFTCKEVLDVFSKKISKLGIEAVIKHLIAVNKGDVRGDDTLHICLERIFRLHVLTGIQWKQRQMQLKSVNNLDMDWETFSVKLDKVQRTITTFQNMAPKVLYYPFDRTFPLVDMYYKDEFGKLVGIQATIAKKHPKKEITYERFYTKIGTDPENTPLKLYYLIIPRQIEYYNKTSYPQGQFWQDVKSRIAERWINNITFYSLVTSDNFKAITP